jgi:serine protease Do
VRLTSSRNLLSLALFTTLLLSPALAPVTADAAHAAVDEELAQVRRTSQAFVRISKQITPAVVNIRTYRTLTSRSYDLSDELFRDMLKPFREFFGDEFGRRRYSPRDDRKVQTGMGSGVIISDSGIVLTNNHVIAQAEEILVTLGDRTELAAELVGSDPRTDIAVLKLPEGKYRHASLGDSDKLEVGEWVMAIGNPFGLNQSVTVGVVSAKGRANVGIADLEDFIQTDAAINPGNSGGPLINLDGEVVGINTAIFSRSGGYQGIGFAVPANMADVIRESLVTKGRIIRADLGLRVQEATSEILEAMGTPDERGALVNEVIAGGVGEAGGVKRGDIVLSIRGRKTEDVDTYYRLVSLLPVGRKVPVVVLRDGMPISLDLTVGELPSRPQDSSLRLRTAMGFSVEELTEELADRLGFRYETGVIITRVSRMSQAERAGIQPGDLVVSINGEATPDLEAFREHFEAVDWNQEAELVIFRDGKNYKVKLKLERNG